MKIIDISEHQGKIDWGKVKGSVDGVILRAGYGKGNVDKYFHENAAACNRLAIPCGAYWFSYAYTPEMARLEAVQFLQAVRQHRMELPLAFDWEYDSRAFAIRNGVTPTAALVQEMTKAFCDEIEKAKYYCMLYTNEDYRRQFFGELAGGRYDLWLASWPKVVDVSKPPRKCGLWQWGGSAVPGIAGSVDSNEAYRDYVKLIADAGLNPYAPPLPWYAEAQDWAKSTGISDGERPTEPATRAEVWQMIYNYFRKNVGSGSGDSRFSGLVDD